jgi:hypothetical protein
LPFVTVAGVTVGRGAMGVSRNGGVSEAASAAGRLDEQPVISARIASPQGMVWRVIGALQRAA